MIKKISRPAIFMLACSLTLGASLVYSTAAPGNNNAEEYTSPAELRSGIVHAGEETRAYRNETVYVVLDSTGKVLDQRIVNRLYRAEDPDAGTVADYGSYLSVRNMTSEEAPVLKEDRVLWSSDLLKEGDIYFEGIIDKEPPVEIEIAYYLDGEKVTAEKLAGKDGLLEIAIRARNRLAVEEPVSYRDHSGRATLREEINYVPLLVQGTFTADLNRFSDIEASGASTIVTGQSMSINFMAFPYPEAEIVLSMQGEDIELDHIVFMIIPQLPPLPELDMEDDLVELHDGISAIGDGLMEIQGGAGRMLQGLEQLRDDSNLMLADLDPLIALTEELTGFLNEACSLIEEISPEQLEAIIELLRELLDNAEAFPDPGAISGEILSIAAQTEALQQRSGALSGDAAELQSTGVLVEEEARKLLAENEPGSELYALGELLLAREEQIRRVASGSGSLERELAGLNQAVSSFESEWEEHFRPVLQALRELAREMNEQLDELPDHLDSLLEALREIEEYIAGIEQMCSSAEEMLENLAALPHVFDRLIEGQRQLKDGLAEIHDQGILEMKKGLAGGIDELRLGAAKMELMRSLADDYRSHADNENNRLGNVQFIMQTERVEKGEAGAGKERLDSDPGTGDHPLLTLWSKLLELFDIFTGANQGGSTN